MSTTGNPFGAAQAMAAFNQMNASNPSNIQGQQLLSQGLTKEQANQQSAQAFAAAVQAANPHLDFSKRDLNNMTGMVDPYQQAEEYYRRYGTGMPQTPGGSGSIASPPIGEAASAAMPNFAQLFTADPTYKNFMGLNRQFSELTNAFGRGNSPFGLQDIQGAASAFQQAVQPYAQQFQEQSNQEILAQRAAAQQQQQQQLRSQMQNALGPGAVIQGNVTAPVNPFQQQAASIPLNQSPLTSAAFSAASTAPTGSMFSNQAASPFGTSNTRQQFLSPQPMNNLSSSMVGPGGTMVQPTQVNSAIQRPGGQGPGGMALEGRYGVSAGNSSPFPIQGQVSLVRMAQGGPVNSSARFSFDDQGKRRFVGAPSGAMSMSQFMPDLPMSSQRPVRTFAAGGSVSNEDINNYIQSVLSSGVSQQEAANQINAAAAQYGVSRDQIAGATGYGLDLVNQYLGAPAAAAPSPTPSAAPAAAAPSPAAASPAESYFAESYSAAPSPAAPTPQAINDYIQNVLSSGVSQQEAANQINAAAAQTGVSREQIASATGYGLDLVNQYLGASTAAALPTLPSTFATTPTAGSSTAGSSTGAFTIPTGFDAYGNLRGDTWTADRYNPNDPTSRGYIADPNAGRYVFDPSTGKHTLVSSTNAPTGAPTGAVDTVTSSAGTNTRQANFEQNVRDWFAANPNATLDQVNEVIGKIDKASYDPFTRTFGLDGMTYKYDAAPGYSQQQFQSIVDQYLAGNPSLTYQQVQSQAQKLGLDYNPYTGKVTYGDITYTTRGPRVSQQEFQAIVDDYFRKNPNATGEDAARVAASIGGEYNPFTQTVKVGDLSYKTTLGAGATLNQFQSLVDKYLLDIKGLNYTGEDLVRDAKSIGGDYNPFTKTVTYKGYTYNVPEAPDATFNQFKGAFDKYLLGIKEKNLTGEDLVRDAKGFGGDYNPFTKTVTYKGQTYSVTEAPDATFNQFKGAFDKYLLGIKENNLTGEDLVREAKGFGGDYNPFTKTVTYKGQTYSVPEAPGPTFNQFKGLVDKYLTDKPNATAADLYLTAKANNLNYDPFTKQVSFGDLTYSPTGIKGYLNVPPDSVIVDQTVVNRYRAQLNELNALAANNQELQPLATRAKQIYDAVLARLVGTKPPPVVTELPPIIDDSRPVVPLPERTQPDANFRRSPPRVWNQLLGAFTYAPPAVVSSPNPRETAGAVGPGQGESWTPPVVTSRPRTLLNVRQNEIDPATGRPRYTAGFDSATGVFTAPVARSIQASSDRSRMFAALNTAIAGRKYTTPEYYSFLANVRGGAYGNPTDPDFASKIKTAVDAYYASKSTS